MNKNTELKRCPFCGGEARIWSGIVGYPTSITCSVCGVSLFGKEYEKVARHWNTRYGEDMEYERGLRNGIAQAFSGGAGTFTGRSTDCIGKEIQANQTGTDGPKIY